MIWIYNFYIMTKIKPIFILFLAAIMALSFSFGFKASAVRLIDTDTQQKNIEKNQNQNQNQGEEDENETSDSEDFDDIASKSTGQINAEIHRSVVANFVQNLLKVASRSESGIGEQVRVVAREQNMTREKVAGALEKVQNRSKIRTFLFGSDYKNLGQLRSEMVQTKNRLEQLTRLMGRTENESDKTELQEQIQTMEQETENIEAFIRTNESKFSLFGWVVKLFSR